MQTPAGLGLGQLLGTLLVPQLVWGMRRELLRHLHLIFLLLSLPLALDLLLKFYCSARALSELLTGTGCGLRDRECARCE